MSSTDDLSPHPAYLVLREDNNWRDVVRLNPGQVTTIGRSPTNRIVVADEVCSRNHCEVVPSGVHWVIRDLGSRNGTSVNGRTIPGDHVLDHGHIIQIGNTRLGFSSDLTKPLPPIDEEDAGNIDADTAVPESIWDEEELETELEILHRQRKHRYSSRSSALVGRDRTSRELARLYRMALDMGRVTTPSALAALVLEGLIEATNADIGAILLVPEHAEGPVDPGKLQIAAYRCEGERPYQRVSRQLSEIVLVEGEAVLARDVANDSRLLARDSLGRIQAESVICAPIRLEDDEVLGLVHLYSTNLDNPLDRPDLEFAHSVADQLAIALKHLREKENLATGLARIEGQNHSLKRQLGAESDIIGESPSVRSLKETISRIAPTNATALIRGESGVGKELVARAIHFGSNRASGPFVCMNCAALTETLLESELFGHEKGSFTGATARKIGKFEQADKGTLFLDEVGEMGPTIQAKFLRVLEGHPFERVGGGSAVSVNVRVVAATNRDLEKAVEEKTFRTDLYFRLHVVQVMIDPLRRRRSDIPILAEYFLRKFVEKTGRHITGFDEEAMHALQSYDWPGNVRELQNTIERTVIMSRGEIVTRGDIQLSHLGTQSPPELAGGSAAAPLYREVTLKDLEREHILATLDQTDWNKSRAARILGIERSTLDRKLKEWDIARPD